MASEQSIKDTILKRIDEAPKLSVFFLTDFAELGSIETVRKVMSLACAMGTLRHVAHGIYAKPTPTRFGELMPNEHDIAVAIAQRDHVQIMPTGATAANIVGLSTQVPLVSSYLTTGSSRSVVLEKGVIQFRHAAPRNFAYSTKAIPLAVQAVKDTGADNIRSAETAALHRFLSQSTEHETYLSDLRLAPAWIQKILKPIVHNVLSDDALATI